MTHTWLTVVANKQHKLHSNRQQTGVVHRDTRAVGQSRAVETGEQPATKQQLTMQCIRKKNAVRTTGHLQSDQRVD